VLVPCNVSGPGLHPKIRITLLDNFAIDGKFVKDIVTTSPTLFTEEMFVRKDRKKDFGIAAYVLSLIDVYNKTHYNFILYTLSESANLV
jgi:hypothetical protein